MTGPHRLARPTWTRLTVLRDPAKLGQALPEVA